MENKEFKENLLVKNLSESKTLEDANYCIDEILESSFRDKGASAFCQIEKCVNILDNSEQDLNIRYLIITRLVDEFYPIARVSDEVIKTEEITKVANKLGEIITENSESKEFKDKCKEAFIQTIILNEKSL